MTGNKKIEEGKDRVMSDADPDKDSRELAAFAERHHAALVSLGILLLRMLQADLCVRSSEPSAIYAIVADLARCRGIDIGTLINKLSVLNVPPITDGFGGSILRQ